MRRSNTSPSMWPSVMPNNSVCAQENNQAKRFTPLLSDTAVQYFRWPLNICIETAHHDLREQKARYTLIIVISSDFDCAWCCVPVGWRIANKLQLALDRIKNVESQMLSMSKVMESKFWFMPRRVVRPGLSLWYFDMRKRECIASLLCEDSERQGPLKN